MLTAYYSAAQLVVYRVGGDTNSTLKKVHTLLKAHGIQVPRPSSTWLDSFLTKTRIWPDSGPDSVMPVFLVMPVVSDSTFLLNQFVVTCNMVACW